MHLPTFQVPSLPEPTGKPETALREALAELRELDSRCHDLWDRSRPPLLLKRECLATDAR